MIAFVARTAYGNARTRALRRGLLGPGAADRLREGATPPRRAATLRAHGIEAGTPAEAAAALRARLTSAGATLSRAYPAGGELLRALVLLHELENLKLALRAVLRRLPRERCAPLWRPLGAIARLDRETCLGASSLAELCQALQRTPYAGLQPLLARPEAELLIDRWGSSRIAAAARALPARERDAAELALMLVRERDLETLSRAQAFGLSPELTPGALALLPVAALHPAADAIVAARVARRKACGRAFRGQPLRLAPAVALLMLLDAQVTATAALIEGGGDPRRALSASAMGG